VGLEQLPNPVLVLSALPNADSADVEPSTCLQAGMHGRMASICIPVVTDAPIALEDALVAGKGLGDDRTNGAAARPVGAAREGRAKGGDAPSTATREDGGATCALAGPRGH